MEGGEARRRRCRRGSRYFRHASLSPLTWRRREEEARGRRRRRRESPESGERPWQLQSPFDGGGNDRVGSGIGWRRRRALRRGGAGGNRARPLPLALSVPRHEAGGGGSRSGRHVVAKRQVAVGKAPGAGPARRRDSSLTNASARHACLATRGPARQKERGVAAVPSCLRPPPPGDRRGPSTGRPTGEGALRRPRARRAPPSLHHGRRRCEPTPVLAEGAGGGHPGLVTGDLSRRRKRPPRGRRRPPTGASTPLGRRPPARRVAQRRTKRDLPAGTATRGRKHGPCESGHQHGEGWREVIAIALRIPASSARPVAPSLQGRDSVSECVPERVQGSSSRFQLQLDKK